MLDVEQLVVSLGAAEVLHGIDLTVDAGEVVALLGPSGCGKTTALRAIAGLVEPDAGRVLVDGVDQAGVAPHRRGLGLMFQDHALFPHLDVAGNTEFGLRMRGDDRTARQARVAEVLSLVRLEGFAARRVAELSGGERQRVALARSLAPEPLLVMLDEPLASLDRSLREGLVLELRELFSELGLAVLYVTHDQQEALALADRLVIMRAGRVVQCGTPQEVWTRPADAWAAQFLGFANVFEATLDVAGAARTGWGVCGHGLPGDVGTSVQILIRPEAIVLVDDAVPAGGVPEDGVPAVVASHAYRGDHSMVRLHTSTGDLLELRTVGDVPAIGAEVRVAVDPAGVSVIG